MTLDLSNMMIVELERIHFCLFQQQTQQENVKHRTNLLIYTVNNKGKIDIKTDYDKFIFWLRRR